MLYTIWLWLLVPFSLYCVSIYLKPIEGARNTRALLAGILGLAHAALSLHATYSLFFMHLPHSVIIFRMTHGMVGGMMVAMVLSMGYRHGAKVLLIVAGILFVGSPVLLVFNLHRIGYEDAVHSIFTSPHFYGLESWPVGIAIPAIVLLLRPGRNDGQDTPIAVENNAENGAGV